MTRDPRNLDQNPLIIDPANVDAVLHDRPTPASRPLKAPLGEAHAEYDDSQSRPGEAPRDPAPCETDQRRAS